MNGRLKGIKWGLKCHHQGVDGHSHTQLDAPIYINTPPIVQAWMRGMITGKAVFTIEKKKVAHFSWEAIPMNLKSVTKNVDGSKVTQFIGSEINEDPFLLREGPRPSNRAESSQSGPHGSRR